MESSDLVCKRMAEDMGYEHISSGKDRATYDRNGCIAKIATDNQGKEANKREIELWYEKLPESIKDKFVAIEDHEKNIGVTQNVLDSETHINPDEIANTMEDILNAGWICEDVHDENFALDDDGNVKLIDYGDGCYRME